MVTVVAETVVPLLWRLTHQEHHVTRGPTEGSFEGLWAKKKLGLTDLISLP